MSKVISLIFILSFTTAFGQIPENAVSISDKEFNEYYLDTANIPRVTGKILNLEPDKYKEIKIYYALIDACGEPWNKKIAKLNPDGSFKLDINKAFPYQTVWLSIGQLSKHNLIVNSDLHIEIDDNNFKAGGKKKVYKFSGTDAELNTYLKQHYLYEESVQDSLEKELRELHPSKESNYDVFLQKYDNTFSQLLEIDNNFNEEYPSPYQWVIQNDRESLYFRRLLNTNFREKIPSNIFEKIKSHKVYVTSENGMFFYRYLTSYLFDKNIGNYPKETFVMEQTLKDINLLDSLFDAPKSDYFKLKIYERSFLYKEQSLKIIKDNLQTEWCKNIALEEYNKLKTQKDSLDKILAKGTTPKGNSSFGKPIKQLEKGAILYKVDSISPEALIQELKNTFQGKAIFIDIWGTWCGACLKAMPDLKQLMVKTKDLPIEYVTLCTSRGSPVATWQRIIAQYELSGTHLYVDQMIVSDLMKLFSCIGYPSYIFIDTKGNRIEENLHSLKGLNVSEINNIIQ